jgi:hypothetical protein
MYKIGGNMIYYRLSASEKSKIRKKIEEYELFHNGWHKLCGRSVKASNIRERAIDKMYVADIRLINSEDNCEELYKDLEYPKNKFRPDKKDSIKKGAK